MRRAFSILLIGLLGCRGSGRNSGPASALLVISGDAQNGFADEELPNPIVVRVVDAAGVPVEGQLINFKVTAGGGSTFAGASITNGEGIAQERWTMGPVTGMDPVPQKLEARAVDSSTGAAITFATFTANAVARPPSALHYQSNPATYFAGTEIAPNSPANSGGPVLAYSVSPALPAGFDLNGATGVITGAPAAVLAATVFTVTARNSGGAATVDLTIQIDSPPAPVIVAQPHGQTVSIGTSLYFQVSASGTGTLAYQWRRNGVAIPGANGSALSRVAARGDGGAVFSVVVSDAYGGSVASAGATLDIQGFTATGNMIAGRFMHRSTLLQDGRVLITGGYPNGRVFNEPTKASELYDPSAGTFSSAGPLGTARDSNTATLLQNGKVLIAGGCYGSPGCAAELFDPDTGNFTPTGTPAVDRHAHAATLLPGGKVLLTGGSNDLTAELYNPADGTFSATGAMAKAHSTATLLASGKVLVAAGEDPAELYDPANGTFAATGATLFGGIGTATPLQSGKVLFVGTGTPGAQLYDPANGTFSPTGPLIHPRRIHTATLLDDGLVLVAGGHVDGDDPLFGSMFAELYDPATGTFASTGSMLDRSGDLSASLLLDGRVLLAGGSSVLSSIGVGWRTANPGAELFDPTLNP